jgi:hypothetical protein
MTVCCPDWVGPSQDNRSHLKRTTAFDEIYGRQIMHEVDFSLKEVKENFIFRILSGAPINLPTVFSYCL